MHFSFAIVLALTFCLSLLFTGSLIWLARRWEILDHPGHRSSHSTPVPRLGGLGIALAFFIGFLLASSSLDSTETSHAMALLGGAAVAGAFGLVDDLNRLSPLRKLALQFLCAALALSIEIRLQPAIGFSPFHVSVALLWLVFFMNTYNFMDGMNGQSGVFGILAALAIAFPAILLESPSMLIARSPLLAAAILGFLPFNLTRPARTFMGDCGSQMIGFVLAYFLLCTPRPFIFPVFLAFWPFVYDVLFTLIRRSLRKKNLLEGHRDHLYQYLLRSGLTHRQVLGRTGSFMIVCFLASLLASHSRSVFLSVAIVLLATVVYTAYVLTRQNRANPAADGAIE